MKFFERFKYFFFSLFFLSTVYLNAACDPGVIAIEAGGAHSLALKSNGTVWSWGSNGFGQLGDGTNTSSTAPIQVKNAIGTGILSDIITIAAGTFHSLALTSDGTVWAWGFNFFGQLGNGTTTSSNLPVPVNGLTEVIAIAAGANHSLAIKRDGTVWAWGFNTSGQVGNGSLSNVFSPEQVLISTDPNVALTNIIAVAGGDAHSLALTSEGAVWAWGANTFGQLGLGSIGGNFSVANQVKDSSGSSTLSNIIGIAAGSQHSLALIDEGTIWAWGGNGLGQLGIGSTGDNFDLPQQVILTTVQPVNLTNIKAITAGGFHSLALMSDGTVWDWGSNSDGQLGIGSTGGNSNLPVKALDTNDPPAFLTGIKLISGGGTSSLSLKSDGTVWAWGNNSSGQLGNGNFTTSNLPIQTTNLIGIEGFQAITGGAFHSLAIKSDGTVWAWGENSMGQLGDGTNNNSNFPVQVSNLTNVIAIVAGDFHSLALKSDGTVWAWGSNARGELGNGTNDHSNVPVQVTGIMNVKAIAAGGGHSMAIRSDATVWSWGGNFFGQLGNGTNTDSTIPEQVINLTTTKAIAAGEYHSLALTSSGIAWAWGDNNDGQLGDGTNTPSNFPVQVSNLTTIKDISAGFFYSLGLISDGTAWGWGENFFGQLGNGTNDTSNIPVQVSELIAIKAIAAGGAHSLSLITDGIVWAWGNNFFGELGDGTNANSEIPIQVTRLTNVKTIAGGVFHSLVIKSDGTIWAWGYNDYGELGDKTNTDSNVPVATILTPVVMAISSNENICTGQTTAIDLSSNFLGSTFSWTVVQSGVIGASNDSGNSIEQTLNATSNVSGTVTYTITATSSDGCIGEPTEIIITVSPIPTATATPQAQTICSGQTTVIDLSSNIPNTTFSWTVVQSGVTGAFDDFGNSIAQILTTTSNSSGTATYTITPAVNECQGDPLVVVVTVHPQPIATATPDQQVLCNNQTTDIVLSSSIADTTFSWTVVQSNVSGASNGSGNLIAQKLTATSHVSGTATYTVIPTVNGCQGNPIVVIVTVLPTPIILATPSKQTICSAGTTAIALSSNIPGTTFNWTVVQTGVTGAFASSGNSIAQTLTTTSNLIGIATYTITPNDPNGCIDRETLLTVKVIVIPTPSATARPRQQMICSGQLTHIALESNMGETTFSWIANQTNVIGASNGSGSIIKQKLTSLSNVPGTVIYAVTPFINGCPGKYFAVKVTVNPLIVPLAPSNLKGIVNEKKFATQTDIVHILSWNASVDPTVVEYRLFQNNRLIETIPAQGKLKMALHNRLTNKPYTYQLVAVNQCNVESPPLTITLP